MIVIPFRAGGKSRLPEEIRTEAALAMLGDVCDVALAVAATMVVTADAAAAALVGPLGARCVADPGGGQGAAVADALAAGTGPSVVLNADLPTVTTSDVEALVAVARSGSFGLVAASDGTTNALALPGPEAFAPLYGPGSAERFRAHAAELGLEVVELELPESRRRRRYARRSRPARPARRAANERAARGRSHVKVTCLSGGVGGAKLVAGLYDVLAAGELTVIGNVGDDVAVLGMEVSPDLDSILYAVAGLNDTDRGWGRAGESWRVARGGEGVGW